MAAVARILVTGAGGLVGRAVAEHLLAQGCHVVGVGRGSLPAELKADWIQTDLSTFEGGARLAGEVKPDAVVHLAAAVPFSRGYTMGQDSADATRAMDRTVIEQVARWDVPLVYASTCGIYDNNTPDKKIEHATIHGAHPYFAAKIEGEAAASGLSRAMIARISSPIGPGMRHDLVLARFVATALRAGELTVWGSGSREQDFIATSDVAAFIARALQGNASGRFNVAAGRPTTMRELAELVITTIGQGTLHHLAETADPGEHQRTRYSIARARDELGWQPAVDLPRMVREVAMELADGR